MHTVFKTQLKNANLKLKEHYNNNDLIKQCRIYAREKINNELNKLTYYKLNNKRIIIK